MILVFYLQMRNRSRSRDKKSKRMNSSSSERSSSFLSSNHSYYGDSSSESDAPEINTAAYELYLKTKKERAELAKVSIIDPNKKCRKLDIDSDFPNYKRKLVVQYIPSS